MLDCSIATHFILLAKLLTLVLLVVILTEREGERE